MSRKKFEVFVHLVWSTRNREPLLVKEFREEVFAVIVSKCRELETEVLAIGAVDDHLHLLIVLPPTQALKDIAKNVKGGSSHFVNHRFKPEPPFGWQSGYAAFSISQKDLPKAIDYVRNQELRHADRKTISKYEPPFD
ncbi:MAG: IS200/IS605 family transposase [Candidatus Omnitrophica bacterium]|nr:IS200/IS605 family transposase [Candidatus Omnitrophota bacterium]